MAHELEEKTAGLASRTRELAIAHTGDASRQLLDLHNRLRDLALAAIVVSLDDQEKTYRDAVKGLDQAIADVGDATSKIEHVTKTIQFLKKVADLVEAAIKA